jgi:hypothetical protein
MAELWSERLAVGSEGSKKPCECCRGRCLCSSCCRAPRGDGFLDTGSFGNLRDLPGGRDVEGEGKETLLLFALGLMTPIEEVRGGWGEAVLRAWRWPLGRVSVVTREDTEEASLSDEPGRSF